MTARTKWGFASACLVAVSFFWACGGSLGSSSGGESHFLIQCDDTCSDGLSCIAGVCTRGCVIDEDSCDDLHPDAQCSDSIEPGEVAVCDLACTGDDQCRSLGSNYECEAGQCRGTINLSSGSGGSSGGSTGTSTSGGRTGGGGGPSCEVLFQEYPDGASFQNPIGCGDCTCTAGEVECPTVGCEVGVPVFACPAEVRTDPVEVQSAFVQGETLLLEVAYSGGCELHDFGLCYEAGLEPSASGDTIVGGLRLIHDSNGDACEAYPSSTLHFRLSPYADYVMQELDVPGGLVDTPFGLYAFGELSCDQARQAAATQYAQAEEQTHSFAPCATAEDCQWAPAALSCLQSCEGVINLAGQDRFSTTVDTIQDEVCDAYVANDCPPVPTLECEQRIVACVDGRCSLQ